MSEIRSKKIGDFTVEIAAAAASLPPPTAAAPPDTAELARFSAWGVLAPRLVTISIDSDGTGSITGGLITAWDIAKGRWRTIALLNGGATVTLTADIGFEELLSDVAIFGPLRVHGTVVGGINVDVDATPVAATE